MAALGRTLLSLVSSVTLSGCVAAVLPVAAAGGFVAHKAGKSGRAPSSAQPSEPVTAARAARSRPDTSTQAAAAGSSKPLPRQLSRMRPGQRYTGALPRPGTAIEPGAAAPSELPDPLPPLPRPESPQSAAIVPPDAAIAPRGPASEGRGVGWGEVVRHVAGHMADTADRSALLARGSTAADPRWVPCGDKPPAVLAPLSLALQSGAGAVQVPAREKPWIDALGTLGVKLVLVARPRDGDLQAVKSAFTKAGLAAPVDGDTLRSVGSDAELPAVRASVGTRYCVVAVAGRDAADFPNGWLPATTPAALAAIWGDGWFLFAP